METRDIKTILRQCTLFSKIDEKSLDLLVKHGENKQFTSGDSIYRKGEFSKGKFCIVLSGRVGIITETGQVVRGMGVGEVIGDVGATSPQSKRTVTVRTVEPTEVLEWDVKLIQAKLPDVMKELKNLAWKNVSNYYA